MKNISIPFLKRKQLSVYIPKIGWKFSKICLINYFFKKHGTNLHRKKFYPRYQFNFLLKYLPNPGRK